MRATAVRLTRHVARLAAVGVIGSVLVTLLPWWPFVLFEHFRLQYLLVGVLVVGACAALRMRGWFDAALIATLINACWVLPDLSRTTRALPYDGVPLRVLVLNVHTSSSAFDEVARLIDDTKPDVVGLLEIDALWQAGLAPTLARYAHRIEQPRDDNFGIALYAHAPLTGAAELLGSPLPTVVATLHVQGRPLHVVLTHPIPPVNPELLAMQLAQLDAVAARARSLGAPALFMGDFNATPWSRPFRELVASTGLCDTRAGFGVQATFPASSLLLRIPIDHVLASCAIGVRDRRIERDVGSDHLPVLIDLLIPRG